MKCRAASKIYKNQPNANQRKILRQECQKEFDKMLDEYNKEAILQMLYILHFKNGYGQKRLERFAEDIAEVQNTISKRYEVNDSEIHSICEIKLRDAGINLDNIFK